MVNNDSASSNDPLGSMRQEGALLNEDNLGGISSGRVFATRAYMDVRRDNLNNPHAKVSYVDYACGWNRQLMKFMGIWPEERRFSLASSYVVFLPIGFMSMFISVPQTINLYYIWGNFDSIVENLSVANVTVSIAVLKTTTFWFSGKSIRLLLSYMEKNRWQAETEQEVRTMTRTAKISRTISIGSTVMCQTVAMLFFALRILLLRYTGRAQLLPAYFPYDSMITPNFEITIIGQSIATIYAATSYTAVDTFVAMLVLHVCGQISNLRHQLTNICSEGGTMFRIRLVQLVRKHNSLNRFVDIVEHRFNHMLLMQMIGCTLQLCVQSFQAILILTGENEGLYLFKMVFLGSYIFYVLLQIYLYCYIGEKLLSESTKIAYAAYDCEWYNLPAKEVKYLLLIMTRTRLPLRITASQFCSFNHELFSNILKTSMGYLSVLYKMKTKIVE